MSSPDKCPSCKVAWNEAETIYEHFLRKYDGNHDKAWYTASMYGHSASTPRYFGVNVIGIEVQGKYDGVSYWKCTVCDVTHDRWTLEPVKTLHKVNV